MKKTITIETIGEDNEAFCLVKNPKNKTGGRPARVGTYQVSQEGVRGILVGYDPMSGRKVVVPVEHMRDIIDKVENIKCDVCIKITSRQQTPVVKRLGRAVFREMKTMCGFY